MPDVAKLSVVVDADTSAAEKGLDGFSSKIGGVGSTLATAFGGVAIAAIAGVGAALGTAVVSGAEFEKQMSAIKAVSGATTGEMESLSDLALKLGADTSYSAKEAAAGIEELVKAGVSIEDVMGGAAAASLSLAAAGAIEVKDAAEIASNALNVFGLEGKDMAHVADVIAGAANASAIGVNDYKFSLSAAGAVAATAGISFESLSEAIAVMGNAGIKGSDAGTSLKTMMMNLIPTSNAQKDLFRELGLQTQNLEQGYQNLVARGIQPANKEWSGISDAIKKHLGLSQDISTWTKKDVEAFEKLAMGVGLTSNKFFDASGNAKSFSEIAQVLQDSMGGMTKQAQLAALEIMFGSDAIRAGAVLLDAGAAGFDKMAESMGKVTAESVAQERLNNLAGAWEQLKGSLETAAITIGLQLMPALTAVTKWATEAVNTIIPMLSNIGGSLEDAFGPDVATSIRMTMSDIRVTIDEVMSTVSSLMDSHGADIKNGWTTTTKAVLADALSMTRELLAVIRLFAGAARGDWETVWIALTSISEEEGKKQTAAAERNSALTLAVIDTFTGGALTSMTKWADDSGAATRKAWDDIVATTTTGTANALKPITDTWNEAQRITETVYRAIANVLTAVWEEIYSTIIKPKLDAISAVVSTVWDAVQAKTKEVFDALLTYLRDTIWEPIRAAVEAKVNAARDAVGAAWTAIDAKAREVFGPLLTYIRDTIFGPMQATVETTSTGISTAFTNSVNAVKGVVDGALQSVKSVWETTWGAIQKAAESPQKAMEVIIDLVNKLKSIMPEWLIPHSPTPFQIGLEGIMKAAKGMDGAFGGMGGGLEMIQRIAAMATQIGGADFGRAAAAISASETGGGASLSEIGGTGAQGPFQFDPGGELRNFAKFLGVSLQEAGIAAVTKPMLAAKWALEGYLGDALRAGLSQGLSGAALANFGSRYGQRPYGDNWKKAGEWFERLFPGYAGGGWAGLNGPELAWLGERGPEYVVPNHAIRSGGSQGGMQTIRYVIQDPSGKTLAEWWVEGRERAQDRGTERRS